MIVACFAILGVTLLFIGQSARRETQQTRQQLEQRSQEVAELREQLAALDERLGQATTNYQTRLGELRQQFLQRVEDLHRQATTASNQLHQQTEVAQRQLADYRNQTARLARDKKTLEEVLAGSTVPDRDRLSGIRLFVLRPTTDALAGATGAAIWSVLDQRGILIVENLPPVPPSQSYQLWISDPKLRIAVNGGLVSPSASGSAKVTFTPEVKVDTVERVAISVEPRGGSSTPAGKFVLSGSGS